MLDFHLSAYTKEGQKGERMQPCRAVVDGRCAAVSRGAVGRPLCSICCSRASLLVMGVAAAGSGLV